MEGPMIFIVLIVLIVIIRAYLSGKNNLERNLYCGGYDCDDDFYEDEDDCEFDCDDDDFDDDYDDFDDDDDDGFDSFLDEEIRAAIGERNYFDDEPGRNYNSYYAQIADDAMMGDESAMEEMRREFGEDDW